MKLLIFLLVINNFYNIMINYIEFLLNCINTKNDNLIDNDLCCICLNIKINKVKINPCKHSFCNKCIKKWKKIKKLCPICRTQINKLYK